MTPKVSGFISGSLEDTDKYIEAAYGHHAMAKKKGQVRIKMCDDNRYPFISTLHTVLLAPIITLMNPGHTCLFQKGFCTVYFIEKEKNAVILPHSAQMKHAFIGKIKNMSKKNKFPARKKIALEFLH